MLRRIVFNTMQKTICTNTYMFYILKNISEFNPNQYNLSVNGSYLKQNSMFVISKRFKSKESTLNDVEDIEKDKNEDVSSNVDNYLNTKMSKIIRSKVPSLRLDVIAKIGFGMSRTRLDKEFYKSNLRINGKKCFKKSLMVNVDDEIDYILNRSPDNPNYLIVNRCILLSVDVIPESDTIYVKLLQNKLLLIEDYPNKYDGVN